MLNEEYLNDGYKTRQDEVRNFVKSLSEQENLDTGSIITHYLSYKPETVEAALIVSVDKGLISYDTKERLWNQIFANFATHDKPVKNFDWEKNNAFIPYVSQYSDEVIYGILEDPNQIIIDVYHALLVIARERELISIADFNRYYSDAKLSDDGEADFKRYDISDLFKSEESLPDEPDESEIAAEKEKYWKCPKCHELVGMEFAVCWNCAAVTPEVVEHPDTQEILNERPPKMVATPVRIGLQLIGAGVIVIIIDMFREYHYSTHFITHLGGYIFGGGFVVLGLGLIIYGVFFNRKNL